MPRNDVLWNRLEEADLEDLQSLASIFRIAEAEKKKRDVLVEEISAAFRYAAGHDLFSLFRSRHALNYKAILVDVLNNMPTTWLGYVWPEHWVTGKSEVELEDAFIAPFDKKLTEQLEKTPPEARKKLEGDVADELRRRGYSDPMIRLVVAGLAGSAVGSMLGPAVAFQIALRTTAGFAWYRLWFAGRAGFALVAGTGATLALLTILPFVVWWLLGPAYRKIIPAIFQLIFIRRLRAAEKKVMSEQRESQL